MFVCMCLCVVFKDSPSVCPSQAAVVSSRLMIQRNYCRSLRTLLHNCPFVLLLVTYGPSPALLIIITLTSTLNDAGSIAV